MKPITAIIGAATHPLTSLQKADKMFEKHVHWRKNFDLHVLKILADTGTKGAQNAMGEVSKMIAKGGNNSSDVYYKFLDTFSDTTFLKEVGKSSHKEWEKFIDFCRDLPLADFFHDLSNEEINESLTLGMFPGLFYDFVQNFDAEFDFGKLPDGSWGVDFNKHDTKEKNSYYNSLYTYTPEP